MPGSIPRPFALSSYDYALPDELIAQAPPPTRREARLAHLAPAGTLEHLGFADIRSLLRPGDLLVVNNTRVIPARLSGNKRSGGQVEVFLERILDLSRALVQIKASRAPKPGQEIVVADFVLTVVGREGRFFIVEAPATSPILDLFHAHGSVPLPPYITRDPEAADGERYQTVFADIEGAVAAPTAGLHFDKPLLEELAAAGVGHETITLHVGAGTFHPVQVEDVREHDMHGEWVDVPSAVCDRISQVRSEGGRVVAVGTTVVRALESADENGFQGLTELFIGPGHEFRHVDALITNFHLPRSTLLVLVCAFAGYDHVMRAYNEAVKDGYRFFSYGDAMFLHLASKGSSFEV